MSTYYYEVDNLLDEEDRKLIALVAYRLSTFSGPGTSDRILQFRDACFQGYCDGCGDPIEEGGRCFCRSDD